MGVNRIELLHLAEPAASEIDWDYLPLREIQILGDTDSPTVRLVLEEDEGGVMHTIYCNLAALRHLVPYSLQLNAWRIDPYSADIPLLPVTLSADGRPSFSVAGAYHDHPELKGPRRQRTAVQLSPLLSDQIRTAAKNLRMTRGEAVLSMILKSASKIG